MDYRGYSSVGKTSPNTKTSNIELIKADILNNIFTRRGERVLRPRFGSIIWDLLFDLSNPNTEQIIRDDIKSIVENDPRVVLKRFKLDLDVDKHAVTIVLNLETVEDQESFTIETSTLNF